MLVPTGFKVAANFSCCHPTQFTDDREKRMGSHQLLVEKTGINSEAVFVVARGKRRATKALYIPYFIRKY
jgi:hypothetical protein